MSHGEPLRVIDAARQFGQLVVEMTQGLPRRTPSGLRGQLTESAQAISSLLAEGFGRQTNGEKIQYSLMANGSLEESQDHLRKCINLKLIERKTFYRLWNLSVAINRMLLSLIEYYRDLEAREKKQKNKKKSETKKVRKKTRKGTTKPKKGSERTKAKRTKKEKNASRSA